MGVLQHRRPHRRRRDKRRTWARHCALPIRRENPVAPVLAQAWRGTGRQANLARLLTGCHTEPPDDTRAKATSTLDTRARTTDIADACVAESALRRSDLIIATDPADLHTSPLPPGQRLQILARQELHLLKLRSLIFPSRRAAHDRLDP